MSPPLTLQNKSSQPKSAWVGPVPEPRHRCYFSLRRCLNTFCGLLLRSGLPNVVEVQPVFTDMSIPFHSVDMYVYMFRCVPGIFQQDHCVASFAFICISWKMIWSSKKISKMSTTARCPSFPNYKSQEKQEEKLYQRDVPTSDSTK